MLIDGKQIAEAIFRDIKSRVETSEIKPHLAVLTCAPNFETRKYLALKQHKAEEVGIELSIIEIDGNAETEDVIAHVHAAALKSDGLIVQFPLPPHIDAEAVVRSIPSSHDVDVLNPETIAILAPVVAAFKEILDRYHVAVAGKIVTVIGSGRLVGRPAAAWFEAEGAAVSIVTKETSDIPYYTKQADIIVCGAGDPGFLKPEMIKDGVVILDAGTSEEGGMLKGDADPACAAKAALFTPVPGGVGPVTVAALLGNLVKLRLDGRSSVKLV